MLMVSYCDQLMFVVHRVSFVMHLEVSTIALKAYFSYTPGPIDLILGRKHRGDLFVCLFVLRFYGPVNPMESCRARSVYLTTRLLGRLSPLSG